MALAEADQRRRGAEFAALHDGNDAFVVPNPMDAGTARILTELGFAALATSSAAVAFILGRREGENLVNRAETLANAGDIVAGTHLPVTADLESCFADTPEGVADTIRAAAAVGLVGGSIEDATGLPDAPIRPLAEAVDRVRAAVEATRTLPFRFLVTARAENYIRGGAEDLAGVIGRLHAFAEAGADVLYAPGLPDADAIRTVCAEVDRPVNALAGPQWSVRQLADLGVRRVSIGSALARAALGAFARGATEVARNGTFRFTADAVSFDEVNRLMGLGNA